MEAVDHSVLSHHWADHCPHPLKLDHPERAGCMTERVSPREGRPFPGENRRLAPRAEMTVTPGILQIQLRSAPTPICCMLTGYINSHWLSGQSDTLQDCQKAGVATPRSSHASPSVDEPLFIRIGLENLKHVSCVKLITI